VLLLLLLLLQVDSYVQDGRLAYNPPEVSRRLLTAHCPREVEERLVNASSRLAQDPTVLVDLMKVRTVKQSLSAPQTLRRYSEPQDKFSTNTELYGLG
jgi:hypothetical protein